jgi:hypothetical protein
VAVVALRDEAPEAHRQLVEVVADVYCGLLPCSGQSPTSQDDMQFQKMNAAVILADEAAQPARWQRELAAWRSSGDVGGRCAVPSLLMCATEQGSADEALQGADTLQHLQLLHSQCLAVQLIRDAMIEQHSGRALPPRLSREVFGTLCTLAPVLRDAAAAAAAAAPAAGQDPSSFGAGCWDGLQSPWTNTLAFLAWVAHNMKQLDFSPGLDGHPDPGGAAAAASAAVVALLRLLPHLPAQPAGARGGTGTLTAAAAAAAAGGVSALESQLQASGLEALFEEPGCAAVMLTAAAPTLAISLVCHCIGLAGEAAARTTPRGADAGTAALTSLAAACRYAHALAAALGLGHAAAGGGEAVPQLLAVRSGHTVLEAVDLLHAAVQAVLAELIAGAAGAEEHDKLSPEQARWAHQACPTPTPLAKTA